jgi:outer membrane biosynthesis protein TonB
MERGITFSILLHTALLLILAFGFPLVAAWKTEPAPMALSVEMVPISEISNLKKSQLPVRDKTPAKPKPSPVEKPKAQPKPEPKPQEPKPEPLPEKPAEKEKPKPEEKKPEPKQKDEFEELLKDLSKEEETQKSEEKPDKKAEEASTKSKSDTYDPGKPLSISEKDAIRSQFAKCWRMPAGVRGDYTLQVIVRVLLNADGTVKQAGITKEQAGRYTSDHVFRAAADSALRAVQLCSPLKNLPPDKYQTWKDLELNFDPKEMLY